jgi:hypothetical protein
MIEIKAKILTAGGAVVIATAADPPYDLVVPYVHGPNDPPMIGADEIARLEVRIAARRAKGEPAKLPLSDEMVRAIVAPGRPGPAGPPGYNCTRRKEPW